MVEYTAIRDILGIVIDKPADYKDLENVAVNKIVLPTVALTNSVGRPMGQTTEILLPTAARTGAATTNVYSATAESRCVFVFNLKATTGGYIDMFMDVQDPANPTEFGVYAHWDNFGPAGTGISFAICDPLSVQTDFGTAKAIVKRVPLPTNVRLRIVPAQAGPHTYSLSAISI